MTDADPAPHADQELAMRVRGAAMTFGSRTLWRDLDLDVHRGEVVAVLGPNGSGKSSLLKAVLGLQRLTEGTVEVPGKTPGRGRGAHVGYVPQQRLAAEGVPARAQDIVGLGIDGHRWGVRLPRRRRRQHIADLVRDVDATTFARRRLDLLSGGEQQRIRIAQALAGDPAALLLDEPLLSLDLAHQRSTAALVDRCRHDRDLGVLFVTHDINPILPIVNRVLYLAEGSFRVGAPDAVLRSDVLSDLYKTQVDVLRVRDRVVVLGVPDPRPRGHADTWSTT